MTKREALRLDCPGVVNDGLYGHSLRDNCWNCAPFWEQYPACPDDRTMLTRKGYCRTCRRHFVIAE